MKTNVKFHSSRCTQSISLIIVIFEFKIIEVTKRSLEKYFYLGFKWEEMANDLEKLSKKSTSSMLLGVQIIHCGNNSAKHSMWVVSVRSRKYPLESFRYRKARKKSMRRKTMWLLLD